MPDDPGSTLDIFFLLALLMLDAYVTLGVSASAAVSDTKLRDDAEDGNKKAKRLLGLLDEQDRLFALAEMMITVTELLIAAFASAKWSGFFAAELCRLLSIAEAPAKVLAVLLLTLVLGFIIIVFGKLIPKHIAFHKPEKFAYGTVGGMIFLKKLFTPLSVLTDSVSKLILKIFGINADEKPESRAEENIRMMLDEGNENGTIEETEKEMINNIFELDDRSVGEVMTHRTELTAVDITSPISEAIDLAISDGYSRMPVYEETVDNIRGFIYVKDLLTLIGDKELTDRKITDFIRPASFIPESNSCREAFLEFQQKKIQVAIVVDEYGGTAGLVSMEDLIESVMGNIQDEYDNEEAEFKKIDADNFDFDGSLLLDDLEDILDIKFPEELDYDTLGGLILDILGRIPEKNENPVVTYKNIEFTVTEMDEHRIERVHARRLPAEDGE